MLRGRLSIKFILMFLLVAAAILSLTVTDAYARTEARYLLRTPDAYFGNDLYVSRSIQSLFHQQTLAQTDVEHYDLSFPATTDGIDLGPSMGPLAADGIDIGSGASSNILPFGLVDLAFPDIHEDSLQTISASRTGFFNSNYNYRSETDYGNIPLSTDYPTTVTQVMQPASMFGWSQLYPEQFGKIAIKNKLKAASAAAAAGNKSSNQSSDQTKATNQTKPTNQTSSGTAAANQTDDTLGTWLNQPARNSTDLIIAPGDKLSNSLDYLYAKNASTTPQEAKVIYPWIFDMADKTVQTYPSNGAGGTFTNGVGSIGATFGRGQTAAGGTVGNQTGNKTGNTTIKRAIGTGTTSTGTTGSGTTRTGTTSTSTAGTGASGTAFTTTPSGPSDLTYADFNFDATTEQINSMPLLERMWRNSHRGGQMGKAYAGTTDAPLWIDPYDRPYDVSMIDEHWYVLQCALNMTQPGTEILPRYWSLMF